MIFSESKLIARQQAEEEVQTLVKRLGQIQQELTDATQGLAKANEDLESKEKILHAVSQQVGD